LINQVSFYSQANCLSVNQKVKYFIMEAPAAVPFALAPAFATPDILNFSEPAAAKLFKSAIEPLSIKFDCSPENLQLFLDQARDKSIVYDWLNILSIPIGGDVAASKDLIES
jgi:hypothetical protein